MLKTIILVLLIAIIITLAVGYYFFFQDKGRSRRVLYALGVRVTLAVLLLIAVIYGLTTGQLNLQTPWNP